MQQDAKSVSFNSIRISNSPILPQRHAPGALPENLTLQKSKGAGKTGCAPHPRSRAQCCRGMLRPSKQVWRKHPAFPAQGKINSSVKFYRAVCSSHPIDHTDNIPVTSHVTSWDFSHTFGTLRGYKAWHA